MILSILGLAYFVWTISISINQFLLTFHNFEYIYMFYLFSFIFIVFRFVYVEKKRVENRHWLVFWHVWNSIMEMFVFCYFLFYNICCVLLLLTIKNCKCFLIKKANLLFKFAILIIFDYVIFFHCLGFLDLNIFLLFSLLFFGFRRKHEGFGSNRYIPPSTRNRKRSNKFNIYTYTWNW